MVEDSLGEGGGDGTEQRCSVEAIVEMLEC